MSFASPSSRVVGRIRAIIIVARDRPELYEYFRAGLADLTDVKVIVDRRIPDDRDDWYPSEIAGGERWEPDVYDELTLRGFVIKRIRWPEPMPVSSMSTSRHPLAEGDGLDR